MAPPEPVRAGMRKQNPPAPHASSNQQVDAAPLYRIASKLAATISATRDAPHACVLSAQDTPPSTQATVTMSASTAGDEKTSR
jgi:hypothetical protein